jgi:hypothetical protein
MKFGRSLVVTAIVILVGALIAPAAITHRYSFNDGTAKDSVGHVDGKLENGAKISKGRLVFDPAVNDGKNADAKTGQYVSFPSNLVRTQNFTIELWVTYRGGNHWQRILDFGTSALGVHENSTIGEGFLMITPANSDGNLLGQISISSWGGQADTNSTGTKATLTLNVPHHIVFTHQPDTFLQRMYVDGELVGKAQATVDPTKANYKNFYLGRSQFTADAFFNGTIDEFRTYDHTLVPMDVAAHYKAGPDVVPNHDAVKQKAAK